MRNYLIIAFALIISVNVFAQKNVFKVHAAPFAWGEVRLGYERAIAPTISLQGNFGFFYDKIPSFIHDIEGVEDYFDTYEIVNTLSGFSSSVDLKIHFGADLKGFYLAPYLKYHQYNFSTPASFDYNLDPLDFVALTPEQQAVANLLPNNTYDIEITGTLDGSVTQIGGGIAIGWQFIIGKFIAIDINPIGFGIEVDLVDIDLTTDIDVVDYGEWLPYVQEEVRNIDYIGDKIEVTGEGNKIHMSAPVPLPTYRGSIAVGIAF